MNGEYVKKIDLCVHDDKYVRKIRRGVSTIEYGILGSLIAMVLVGSVSSVGNNTVGLFCNISAQLSSTVNVGAHWCINGKIFDDSTSFSNTYGMSSLISYIGASTPDKFSGFYTSNGKQLKTMADIQQYFGLSDDNVKDIWGDEAQSIMNKAASEGKNIIFPIPSDVSWTSTDGSTYNYSGSSLDYSNNVDLYYYTNSNNQRYVLTMTHPVS